MYYRTTKYSCWGWTNYSWFVLDLWGKNEPIVYTSKFIISENRALHPGYRLTGTRTPQLVFSDDQQFECNFRNEPKNDLGVAPTVPHPLLYHVWSLPTVPLARHTMHVKCQLGEVPRFSEQTMRCTQWLLKASLHLKHFHITGSGYGDEKFKSYTIADTLLQHFEVSKSVAELVVRIRAFKKKSVQYTSILVEIIY